MSSFDIPIDLNRLRNYHPFADALAEIEEKKGTDLTDYQFNIITKFPTRKETEVFIEHYTQLLTQFGFTDDYIANDLLFFSTFIYQDIERINAEYKAFAVAKTTLKSLVDLLQIQTKDKPGNIKIEIKGVVGGKSVVEGAAFINVILPEIIDTLRSNIYNCIYNEKLANLLHDTEPTHQGLSKVYDELKLTKKRPYIQAVGYNTHMILNYLNHETILNKGVATLISDLQCQFIYQYLCLFEFLDDNIVESDPKDYIRSMMENSELK